MALGFLVDRSERLLEGALRVRSSGTWARPELPPTDEAAEVAASRGIDISEHRSTPFAGDLAEWADLIVTMTGEQREEVLESVPDAGPKTFTMKELVALFGGLPPADGHTREAMVSRIADADRLRRSGEGPRPADEDVADPIGMSEDTYRSVGWELEELTDALVRGLAGVNAPVTAAEGEG
jgi:protein-tyrosine phosphatase